MRLAECFLRGCEIAHAEADRADLVVALCRDRRDLPLEQPIAREPYFLLGLREPDAQRRDLGAMHAADAGEAADGLSVAPTMRGLGPVARATDVGDVAARADRAAVHAAGDHQAEVAAHRG